MTTGRSVEDVLADLAGWRAADPPTHGGRVLSYVYDPGRPELDRVAAEAVRLFLPVNGLDPTTFTLLFSRPTAIAEGGTAAIGGVPVGTYAIDATFADGSRTTSNSDPSSARISSSLTTGGPGSCGSRAFPASTTPTLVLLDRAGHVALYHPGAMPYGQLRAAIEKVVSR